MKHIAKFEKISFEQFKKDLTETTRWIKDNQKRRNMDIRHPTYKELKNIYDAIQLPVRATKGSAGYDFKTLINITLRPKQSIKIPTGIRVKINEGWVLQCYPRSGLGVRYRLQLDNTVGIIDNDYYDSDNEGHIFAEITNDSNEGRTVIISQGTGFMQGVFVRYGVTIDNDVNDIRNGGFGSTGK